MPIRKLANSIDALLRGQTTSRAQLEAGRVDIPARSLLIACVVLGGFYGVMMGLYGATNRGSEGLQQLLASTVKTPLLFLATLAVTFPSLYVFSALAQSRLMFGATLRLLLAATAVNLAVLASFGPVTAFFTLSTTSHPFMVLLNVVLFGIAGLVGLGFVNRALGHAFQPVPPPADEPAPGPAGSAAPPRRPRRDGASARGVFTVWLVIYGIVGAQMGWILRPFVGGPAKPFEWFRERDSNFFAAVLDLLGKLLGS